ncbi:hypothetical protein BTR23_21030 [Alkalihalophilus pseudofirmus]|nr:hypothetical protein BTR23_21030 [Alkalihalophilus pseudofirmus]
MTPRFESPSSYFIPLSKNKINKSIRVGDISERHDLMGFTFKDANTMISSGHPNINSKLENPLGIVISKDEGELWEPISLHGDIDFHVFEVNASDTNIVYGIDVYEDL